jgi:Lrp/AsnC family transcriptional regulator of lysine biosynthesis
MDKIDIEILEILKKNSRTKYVEIAKRVDLTEGAVRRRMKKLLETRSIKKFTIETSIEMEGIVLIKTDPAETRRTVLKIREIANRVFEVSGDYDVAALIQTFTMEELNERVDQIRDLPLVLETNTLIRLD